MKNPIPIMYAAYWDFPLTMIARYGDLLLFFDRWFDEEIDDYESSYAVYLLPDMPDSEFSRGELWQQLPEIATRDLGRLNVSEIEFDSTRRKEIDAGAIARLLRRSGFDVEKPAVLSGEEKTVRIIYREYSDVPRSFVAQYKSMQIYLICKIKGTTGDYEDHYRVYLLPEMETHRLLFGSWLGFELTATKYLGNVNVTEVRFDATRRKEMEVAAITPLLESNGLLAQRP